MVYDVSSGTAASPNVYGLGLRSLGAGLDGDVVIFAGKMFDRAMWQDAFTGTEFDAALVDFLGEGADSLPLIAPYRAHKSFGVAVPDLSRLENVYLAFGIAFFILGGAMLVRRQAPGPKRQARKPGPAAPRKASLPPFTFFQPIVSQEELIDADEDVSLLAHIPKFMNRAADAAARGGKTPVKSRP